MFYSRFRFVLLGLFCGFLLLGSHGCFLAFGLDGEPFRGEIVEDTCPVSHSLDCGNWCCPSGTSCNANGPDGRRCRVDDTPEPEPFRGELAEETCPGTHPLDCGSWCCPSGTTCNTDGPEGRRCRVGEAPEPTEPTEPTEPVKTGNVGDLCSGDSDCGEGLVCDKDAEESDRRCEQE